MHDLLCSVLTGSPAGENHTEVLPVRGVIAGDVAAAATPRGQQVTEVSAINCPIAVEVTGAIVGIGAAGDYEQLVLSRFTRLSPHADQQKCGFVTSYLHIGIVTAFSRVVAAGDERGFIERTPLSSIIDRNSSIQTRAAASGDGHQFAAARGVSEPHI